MKLSKLFRRSRALKSRSKRLLGRSTDLSGKDVVISKVWGQFLASYFRQPQTRMAKPGDPGLPVHANILKLRASLCSDKRAPQNAYNSQNGSRRCKRSFVQASDASSTKVSYKIVSAISHESSLQMAWIRWAALSAVDSPFMRPCRLILQHVLMLRMISTKRWMRKRHVFGAATSISQSFRISQQPHKAIECFLARPRGLLVGRRK